MNNNRTSLLQIIMLTMLLVILASCGAVDNITTSLDEATRVIDKAIADMQAGTVRVTDALQRVADELPDSVAEVIREEAQNLATRSIAQAGTEILCATDILVGRTVEQLTRLKDALSDGNLDTELPPVLCQVVPSSIDLSTNPESWDTVTLHGYDLDTRDGNGDLMGFAVLHTDYPADPYIHLEEEHIGRTTHYQVTLNLREYANQMYRFGAVKVIPFWNDEEFGEAAGQVVVKRWQAQIISREHEPETTTYIPPHRSGDRDFDTGGDDPMVVLAGAVTPDTPIESLHPLLVQKELYGWQEPPQSSNTVLARVGMYALETEGDHTHAFGWGEWQVLYEAPPGWRIKSVEPSNPATLDDFVYITSHGASDYNFPGGTIAKRFTIYGDTDGDDAQGYTKVVVDWQVLSIELEETQPSWYSQ